jgi:sterol 14-demethylase
VNAAWLLIYLATNADWYNKVRKEVDSALLRHGAGSGTGVKEVIEVMARLNLEEWTGEFPLIDVCLKETIRFQLPGTFCRKNTSGRSLSIAGSNEIIPKDAFAVR